MKKYKAGDVAALFSKPKEGSMESGKKLKSLFDDFYSKSKKKPNRSQSPIKSQNTNTQNEKLSPQVVKKNGKEKKQKKSFDTIPSSKEDNVQSKRTQLSPRVHQEIDFPRRKPKRNRNFQEKSFPSHTVNEMPEQLQNEISFASNENNTSGKKSNKKKKLLNADLFSEDNSSSFQHKKKKQKHLPVLKSAVESDLEGSDVEGTFETSIRELNKNPVVKKKNKRKFDQTFSEEPDIETSPMKLKNDNDSEHSSNLVTEKKSHMAAINKKKSREGADFIPLKAQKVQTEESLKRTVFVGNLPLNFTKKGLQKLFSPFGALETIRLRGAIPQKPNMPKKVAEIKGKYHSKLHSVKAYVVFQKEKEAMESLTLNGTVIENHHIVVDIAKQAGEHKMYDNMKSVFVGNLPFDIADEMLWSSFEHCGDVEAVRVIRDRETGAGKGFGYISFHNTEGRDKALALKDVEIGGRVLRIKPVEKQSNKNHQQKPRHFNLAKKRAFEERNQGSKKSVKKIIKKGKLNQQKKNIAKFLTKQQN